MSEHFRVNVLVSSINTFHDAFGVHCVDMLALEQNSDTRIFHFLCIEASNFYGLEN